MFQGCKVGEEVHLQVVSQHLQVQSSCHLDISKWPRHLWLVVAQCCHLVACVLLFTGQLYPSAATWWPMHACSHICCVLAVPPGGLYMSVYKLTLLQSYHVVTWASMFDCLVCSSAAIRLPGHICADASRVLMLAHDGLSSLVCMHAESQGQHTGAWVCPYSDLPYPCVTTWWHR